MVYQLFSSKSLISMLCSSITSSAQALSNASLRETPPPLSNPPAIDCSMASFISSSNTDPVKVPSSTSDSTSSSEIVTFI